MDAQFLGAHETLKRAKVCPRSGEADEHAIQGRRSWRELVIRQARPAACRRRFVEPASFYLSPAAAVIVIAVTATLSWFVTRLWFENLMLANLGTPPWIAASLVSIPPLVLEVVVAQAGPV
jgi:hypothetical protein